MTDPNLTYCLKDDDIECFNGTISFNHLCKIGRQLSEKECVFDNNGPLFLTLIACDYIINIMKRKAYLYRINDSMTSIFCSFFLQLIQLTFRATELKLYWWVHENYAIVHLPWNSVWTILSEFFVVEFIFYWFHRLSHEVHILWAAHQMHHNSEEYNLAVALRQSVFLHFTKVMFYLPEMLIFPPHLHVMHYYTNMFYQFFLHTPLLTSFGPLDYVLNTPSHHRVHHGRNPYCIDKNFGGVLIIFDHLFGTFQAEKPEEPVSFGLITNVRSFNLFYIQFFYFNIIYQKFRTTKGVINKLKCLIYGPSWSPGKPRLGHPSDFLQIDKKYVKYNSTVSRWLQFYVLVHASFIQLAFMKFYAEYKRMNNTDYIFNIYILFYAVFTFSLILDANRHAGHFELFRLIVICYWYYSYVSKLFFIFPLALYAIMILSIAMWMRNLFLPRMCLYNRELQRLFYYFQCKLRK